MQFLNVLTSAQWLGTTEALMPEHRERLYLPTVTLSIFMRQVPKADGPWQKGKAMSIETFVSIPSVIAYLNLAVFYAYREGSGRLVCWRA